MIELPLFCWYHMTVGYTTAQMCYGVSASACMFLGTLLMIYASTHGLAGPCTAMVQSQGVVHVLMNFLVLS